MDDRSPFELDALPEELLHLVKPELQPGERLLWASSAGTAANLGSPWPSKIPLTWFFGLLTASVVGLSAVPLGAGRGQDPSEGGFLVIGTVAGTIAFFFAVFFVGNFFSKTKDRARLAGQVYALTDRRAMIWVPGGRSAVAVYTFQQGTIGGNELHRVQYPDGSGDVLFQGHYFGGPCGFIGVADVRRVEELVRRFLVVPGREPDRLQEHFDD